MPKNKVIPKSKKVNVDEHVEESISTRSEGVYIEKSVTKNMGNYNSAKVTIGITIPLDAEKSWEKKVNRTIERGMIIIDDAIEEEVDYLIEEIEKNNSDE